VKELVHHQADITIKNNQEQTPMDVALIGNHKAIVNFLQSLKKKLSLQDLEIQSLIGRVSRVI
jgi:hypothetical protein